MTNGTFIMIDGIAGSGKTTVIQAMFKELVARGLRCFRLQDWKETHPPRFEEIPDFDVYFTSEPTRQWIGAAIREEMSRVDQLYGGEELAHAFALDREIMYRRLIIPAKRAKKSSFKIVDSAPHLPIKSPCLVRFRLKRLVHCQEIFLRLCTLQTHSF